MTWQGEFVVPSAAFGLLAALFAWAWIRQAAELRSAWKSEEGWRGPAKEAAVHEQERVTAEACGCGFDRVTGVLTRYCAEHDPEAVHTFVIRFADRRKRERPRSYKGPLTEAKAAARRWLDQEPEIAQILTEDGDLVTERGSKVPFRGGA